MPESTPSLPNWLARGMADLFPAGDPSAADQALAARLVRAQNDGPPTREEFGSDPPGSKIH